MSDERPDADDAQAPKADGVRWARRRLPFEAGENPLKRAPGRGGALIYAMAAIGFGGAALYMGLIERRPLTSGYVMAPAIGAVWFALRWAMMFGSRS